MVLGVEPRSPEPQTAVWTINNATFIARRDDEVVLVAYCDGKF